ncbi:ATP-binding cassette domain-containing protein [Saccharopolyspora sp. WRP15-2]|uniref:ATP-binding cassette domain-containing protein n=1 Tax=Saccharopolyspora oryzae TaxID=2997343 RepID=A0ABT4UXR9_9PSEU|nr:oligopeptide/dipeptide ABC transporter ATP-binding protein [Saccharopolyspora oryzae]MDA3626343.1 ATP-binding cassette domain-containing protein [Saccharopolyspora oryzae]
MLSAEASIAAEDRVVDPVLSADDLVKSYPGHRKGDLVQAVRGVSLSVPAGKTIGVVGESGCGKSTLARLLVGLEEPTSGSVSITGQRVDRVGRRQRDALMRRVQMVFQSPFTSLDPRMTVLQIIREPLDVMRPRGSRAERVRRAEELMDAVGLPDYLADRRPGELSGGQLQRVGLARALASGSDVVICDEPVSALDVSIQAQVINLLKDLQEQLGVAYIFIAHNLSVVATISDYIAVMYLGRVVEYGSTDDIYDDPKHPYTKALLSSAPVPVPDANAQESRIVLEGDLPSPAKVPSGCAFRTRCWKAQDICASQDPALEQSDSAARSVACHFPE